ncbi:hypothetical protein L107_09526 [Cyanobium sp. Copco_Reservoir_LC18]|nr:hypothetical protein L107_09526 [Cyanobium sp. Copco_Reservoir_LC18]
MLRIDVAQTDQPQAPHRQGQVGDGHQQRSGDLAEGAALVPELHGLLQGLRIERPPLAEANTPSIRQCHWPI